jgi:predicted NBD/HSP70 family sugar kinase
MKRIYLQRAKTQIARPNTIRDINKQIVLNYVRDRSPISRADIARETALQRSTVSAIVDDLQTAGLIEEIGTGNSTGGRKPTLLKLKSGNPVAVGIDLKPTLTTIAVADLAGKILSSETFTTSADIEFMTAQIITELKKIVAEFKGEELQVGVSVPGIADPTIGKVLYIPYFQWRNWNIAQVIKQTTGLSATVENDANATALAELWFGREEIRKTRNFISVMVAEGIGTGIIFEGQIYRGEKGAAGEFGHMIVGTNAPVKCSCGSRDCWEAHASEKAMTARYQNLFSSSLSNGGISFPQLINLAKSGEKQALQALKETTKFLGIGISNLIVGFSPQAVVVSGNIVKAWDLIVGDLQEFAERSVRQGLPRPSLVASSLGENPSLIGALSLVLARKFASAS